MEFMLKWSRVGSNLDQRNYMHIFTLLTSWDQVGYPGVLILCAELDIDLYGYALLGYLHLALWESTKAGLML